MSEIKVGDFVNVIGYAKRFACHLNNLHDDYIFFETGTKFRVDSIRTGDYFGTKYQILDLMEPAKSELQGGIKLNVHRKQCRLLVKVRKCDVCNGIGEIPAHSIGTGGHVSSTIFCKKCNGKGKVKA